MSVFFIYLVVDVGCWLGPQLGLSAGKGTSGLMVWPCAASPHGGLRLSKFLKWWFRAPKGSVPANKVDRMVPSKT